MSAPAQMAGHSRSRTPAITPGGKRNKSATVMVSPKMLTSVEVHAGYQYGRGPSTLPQARLLISPYRPHSFYEHRTLQATTLGARAGTVRTAWPARRDRT